MIKYSLSREADRAGLKQLWLACFDDSAEYVELFLSYAPHKTYVAKQGDTVLAAVHLLPYRMRTADGWFQMNHLYAVSALREWRGKGVMDTILRNLQEDCKKENMGLTLRPANKKLREYYGRYGFEEQFFLREVQVTPEPGEQAVLRSLTTKEYLLRRDSAFISEGYGCWPFSHIKFAVQDNQFFGGSLVEAELHGKRYFLLLQKKDDKVEILETDMDETALRLCAYSLCTYFGARNLTARLKGQGEYLSGISYNTPPLKGGYLNLILT